MNRFWHRLDRSLAFIVMAAAITGFWPHPEGLVAKAKSGRVQDNKSWAMTAEPDGFIIESDGAGTSCRESTLAESQYFNQRDPDLILRPINEVQVQAEDGLNITLRGTAQLDSFPDAKAAFERAAATWESLIASPISIIVDVDFGTQRFGVSFPEGVIGATGTQSLGNSIGYISLRPRLIAGASDPAEAALYNALPNPSVVTDGGPTTAIVAPAANLRAIGEIPANANPPAEPNFGAPPGIGFNSAFAFDFDPSNGIDADKIDFDAVATHEIGHALGFSSQVGAREINVVPLAVSVLDIFRFRPGISTSFFTQAQRILASGGDQVFFAGGDSLALSTGRPNGTGGDGQQPSHWKDDDLSGQYLGVMDPTIEEGFRGMITPNDLAVLNALGYRVNAITPPPPPAGNNPPVINSIVGALSGDTLSLTVDSGDIDGDLTQAELSLLDQSNNVLTQLPPIALADDPSLTRTLNLTVNGIGQFPEALKVRVALVDRRSNRSGNSTLDFSVADSGGPDLRKVSFDGIGSMTIKGGPFVNPLELEINGAVVAPPLRIKVKGAGGKLKIGGSQSELNLRTGANRVRILMNGLRSNVFVLSI